MALIFYLSSQTAADSSATSEGFITWILTAFFSKFENVSPTEQKTIVDSCQFIARKTAHFSLYAVLGILWYPAAYAASKSSVKAAFWAWAAATAYAITDEIHQRFVPGRSGEFRDILIDSAGAAVGVLLLYMIATKVLTRRKIK